MVFVVVSRLSLLGSFVVVALSLLLLVVVVVVILIVVVVVAEVVSLRTLTGNASRGEDANAQRWS